MHVVPPWCGGQPGWFTAAVLRPDREDTSAQIDRVAAARDRLREALEGVVAHCGGQGDLDEVRSEARFVVRALGSRAKRPPPVDVAPFFGEVSAAQRKAVRSDEFDAAVRAVRDAESELDLAVDDLATARGDDG